MKFKGIIPALPTPLCGDETINIPVLKDLINFLIEQGSDGFYIGGATGEGLALKTEERMVLAENAVAFVNGKKPCIVQVAAADFKDAVSLAKHAEKIGADAISATAPGFFVYDENDIYNYYKALAESVHIPMMIYYSPAVNFAFSSKLVAKMFEIDNITAIKWTNSNYFEMMRLKDLTNGEINILNGPDEMLLMGLSACADGGIGATYSLMLENFRGIYDNFMAGDMEKAQLYQIKVQRVVAALIKHKVIPGVKAVLEEKGFKMGYGAFPTKRYTPEEKEKLIADLKGAGLKI